MRTTNSICLAGADVDANIDDAESDLDLYFSQYGHA